MHNHTLPYDLILFDFDGTLADTFDLFITIVNTLSIRHGFCSISINKIDALRRLPPHKIILELGVPKWKLPMIARDFLVEMRRHTKKVSLFDGIRDTLITLHSHGCRLGIVSSNSPKNCRDILGRELCNLISHIDGSSPIFGKSDRITRILKKTKTPRDRAIYIGDQLNDAEAAHTAGIDFGGVRWGYSDPDSLARCRPKFLFDSVRDLEILINKQHYCDS